MSLEYNDSFGRIKLVNGAGQVFYNGLAVIHAHDNIQMHDDCGPEDYDDDYLFNNYNNIKYTMLEDNGDFRVGDKYQLEETAFSTFLDMDVDDSYFDSKNKEDAIDFIEGDSVSDYEFIDSTHKDYKYCSDKYNELKQIEANKSKVIHDALDSDGFVRMSVKDMDAMFGNDVANPYWTGFARIRGLEDSYVMADVLHTEHTNKQQKGLGRLPVDGDYLNSNYDCVTVIPLTEEEKARCVDYAKEFDDMHANAPYKIIGRIFSEEPTYYSWDEKKSFPKYEELRDMEREWIDENVHSLEDAEKWLISNHPDYYMGSSIIQNCPSGNFSMFTVPCGEYPEGMYETIENRRKWAQKKADDFGIEVGPFEYNVEGKSDKSQESSFKGEFETKASNRLARKSAVERELPDIDYGDSSNEDTDDFNIE